MLHPKLHQLCLLLLLFYVANAASSSLPDGLLQLPSAPMPPVSLEHMDPTLPPVLPGESPRCSVLVLQHEFGNTVGAPPVSGNYTQPPECPFPWTHVVLEVTITASDLQQHRVAAVWIDGAEVLRTMTPRPMAPGAFWSIRKDVTRYITLFGRLSQGAVVSMMLENSNTDLPGVFSASVSLHFYRGAADGLEASPMGYTSHPSIKGLYREPANLIIPLSKSNGYCGNGFWFRINNDTHVESSLIAIPKNTYRAVLEVFVSYHGDDESWYMNPLGSVYRNRADGLSERPGNGGYRQFYVTIDGRFAGGRVPFPVLYPGTINPYLWSPVAAIGVFDMPSYDLDLTPFLGFMLDGRPHELGLGVHDAQQYWLVSANLHLWVDEWSDAVQAGLMEYYAPPVQMNRNAEWRNPDGQSEVGAEGTIRFAGWVSSSKGNVTTIVQQKIKYRSQVEVQNRGKITQVEVYNKERMVVSIQMGHQVLRRAQLLVEAPLQLQTTLVNNAPNGAVMQRSKVTHQLVEQVNLGEGQVVTTITLTDRQDAEGDVLMAGDGAVWGSGRTRSTYRYKDDRTCYTRNVNAMGGLVMADTKTRSC